MLLINVIPIASYPNQGDNIDCADGMGQKAAIVQIGIPITPSNVARKERRKDT
jgi:hypothetical protein